MKFSFKKILFLLSTLMCVFIIFDSFKYTEQAYRHNKVNEFSKGWTLVNDNSSFITEIDTPYSGKSISSNNKVCIQKVIPNKPFANPYLKLGSPLQGIKIYLDNELIYDFNIENQLKYGATNTSRLLLIPLPNDCFGKTIKIEFTSINRLLSKIEAISFGSKFELFSELFSEHFLEGIISISLLVLSIISFLLAQYCRKKHNINFHGNYIAPMLFIGSIWLFSESQFYIFIFNNYFLFCFLEFLTLILFPIILYKYIYLEYKLKNKAFFYYIYKMHCYLFFILMLLCFFIHKNLIFLEIIFTVLFIFSFLSSIIVLFFEKHNNPKIKFLLTIMVILFVSFISNIFLSINTNNSIHINFLIIGIILIELCLLFKVFAVISNAKNIDSFNSMLNLQLEYQAKLFKKLEESNLEVRSYKHDMLNHLNIVYNLMKNNDITNSKNYLGNLIDDFLNEKRIIIYTGNPVLDAILTEKIEYAKRSNIKVNTELFISKELKLDLLDCCTLFTNILDNAIEACNKIENNNKYINIQLNSKGNILIGKVVNSINKDVKINNNYSTTKTDYQYHGLGLKNIENVVKKYNGELSISHNDLTFQISFILFNV